MGRKYFGSDSFNYFTFVGLAFIGVMGGILKSLVGYLRNHGSLQI